MKLETDKDVLKNVADFFYESINNFKRNLNDLSLSINNFLHSLNMIEKQLGYQGFDYPENSSELLYERLVQNKEERERKQKEFIKKLTQNPASSIPKVSPSEMVEKVPPIVSAPKPGVPSKVVGPPKPPIKKAGPIVEPKVMVNPVEIPKSEDVSIAKLKGLREEMLETVRKLKKLVKDY